MEGLIDRIGRVAGQTNRIMMEVLKLEEMTKLIDTGYPSDHKFHPNGHQLDLLSAFG